MIGLRFVDDHQAEHRVADLCRAMEAFWATLKKEIRHIRGPIEGFTRSETRTILFDYIEIFYNRQRHQAGLDDRTPAETYAAHLAA